MEEAWELAVVSHEKDQIEVSAGEKGIAVKAVGGAASRLGHSIADLISPFSNFTGLIGDEIRNLRIYREAAMQKALQRSHEIVIENGIDVKPVSTKFLVNWSEGASMEDAASDDNLIEMWSQLLARNSESEDSNATIYTDVLKKLRKPHAIFLSDILKGEFSSDIDISELEEGVELSRGRITYLARMEFGSNGQNYVEELSASDSAAALIGKILGKYLNIPEVNFLSGTAYHPRFKYDPDDYPGLGISTIPGSTDWDEKPLPVIHGLEALNLVERIEIEDFEVSPTVNMYLDYVRLTRFGREFLKSVGLQATPFFPQFEFDE